MVVWHNGASEPVAMIYTISMTGGSALFRYLDDKRQQFAVRKVKFDPVGYPGNPTQPFVINTRIRGIYGSGALPDGDTLFLGMGTGAPLALSFTPLHPQLFELRFNATALGYCKPST